MFACWYCISEAVRDGLLVDNPLYGKPYAVPRNEDEARRCLDRHFRPFVSVEQGL